MSTKILTVDDSKTIRLIISKILKDYDCTVLEGANGVEGLAAASTHKPDLILLDYTMPMMDGSEVLARLRADEALKATPVIMLTAEAGRDMVLKIAKLGVRDYLLKPFKEDMLLERINRVIPLKRKSAESARNRRYDDPISILVVEDKSAVVDQIKRGLASTPWRIRSAAQPEQALDSCMKEPADLLIVNLALPEDGALTLLRNLRGNATTSAVPVLGLTLKTDTEGQARAQQMGFAGVITKPIDLQELPVKICRTLRLETSYRYFQQKDGALLITLPKEGIQLVLNDLATQIASQLDEAVNSGADRLVIDLSQLEKMELPLVEFVQSATESCAGLSLKHAVIASDPLKAECANFTEAQSWSFVANLDAAMSRAAA